jgi:hypothetical protein
MKSYASPHFVIPNLFRDNKRWPFVVLKQVQDDDSLESDDPWTG